ncbi:hypothetical protein B0H12DRAFT_993977, partial [Mycena haematopus]
FFLALLSVPFNGIVVRYRAASHPKASVEDGSVPPPPTFFSMAKRVWRLQGAEGLTRGLMPTIGALLFYMIFWAFGISKLYVSPSPPIDPRSPLLSLISTLIYTVFLVTTMTYPCRSAITSPRKLDVLNAREALHILFSVHERKKPWVILQTPGLLPAMFVNLGVYNFFTEPLSTILLPFHGNFSTAEYAIRIAGVVLVALLGTIVRAPLEVITTRLALQRNYGGIKYVDESTGVESIAFVDDSTAPGDLESAAVQSPVVAAPPGVAPAVLRSENEPYLGLIDCAQRITAEEGWPVLYRMWFLTLLGS